MAKEKTVYVCSNCGQDSPKWVGKCPSCGMWNTYVEEVVRKEVVNKRPVSGIETAKAKPITLHEIVADDEPRIDLHDAELNRVLGGGLVQGSLVLIGGEPGIGKSTLVLQTVLRIPEKRILYVSGEESTRQLKLRADRLTSASSDCLIVCETSLEQIYVHIKNIRPDIVIIDSIQTISTETLESSPGSIAQVRECSASILRFAKETHTAVILIGHINKEGKHSRPQRTGTYRGYRTPVRGRPALHVPHPAQHQEPLRKHCRTGYLRNAARWITAGEQPIRTAAEPRP